MDFPFSVTSLQKIADRLDEKYTVPDILQKLEELAFGEEQLFFNRLRTVISEVAHDEPDIRNQFITTLNVSQCASMALPRLFHLCKVGLIAILQTLSYVKVTRMAEIKNMDPDVRKMFHKIAETIMFACYEICVKNKARLLGYEAWETVPYSEMKLPLFSTTHRLDKGAWNEFMELLSHRKEIMHPSPENCILF